MESPLSAVTFAGRLNALSLHRSDLPLCDPEHLRECEREHLRLQAQLRSFARLPDTNFSCPICRDDCRVICVDGIFKLWQHASAAESGAGLKPVAFPAPGDVGALYESPERVSAVLATLDKHCTKLRKTCGSAQIDAMAGKTHPNRQIMAVTGTYCACCKHGILLKAFDFKEGEKASYPLAMYLLCQQRADVLVGDSLCRCNKFFERAASNSDEIAEGLPEGMRMFDPSGVQLKVNAMHVQGVWAFARSPCALPISSPLSQHASLL